MCVVQGITCLPQNMHESNGTHQPHNHFSPSRMVASGPPASFAQGFPRPPSHSIHLLLLRPCSGRSVEYSVHKNNNEGCREEVLRAESERQGVTLLPEAFWYRDTPWAFPHNMFCWLVSPVACLSLSGRPAPTSASSLLSNTTPVTQPENHRRRRARGPAGVNMSGVLFEDIFEVGKLNPDGKKFHRGESRKSNERQLVARCLASQLSQEVVDAGLCWCFSY